jgi:hypothetical protein
MNTLDGLFNDDAQAVSKPKVQGKWFEVRLAPDLSTGEVLNIGVGFVQARTRRFYFRLLRDASPLQCLYGPAAREQFSFLLKVVHESLSTHGPVEGISPQITFGQPRYAAGDTPDQILDTLYRSMVTLARRRSENDGTVEAVEFSRRSTERVRDRVRKAFRTIDPDGAQRVWRTHPVPMSLDDGLHTADLQIFKGEDLLAPTFFGSVISACYKHDPLRRGYMGSAFQSLATAREFGGADARGRLFVLSPSSEDEFQPALMRDIENEIDNAAWALGMKFNIVTEAHDSIERIKELALEFASS